MKADATKFTFEIPEMQPKKRLWELIIHIANAHEFNEKFGKTKLVKLLYYSDFNSFRLSGKPITGAKYVKLPNGPVPDQLNALLGEMAKAGDVEIKERYMPGYDKPQMRVVASRDADYSLFTAQDIARVDELIRTYWNDSGSELAKSTHGIVVNTLELQEPVPYEASIISDEELTEDDLAGAKELIEKYG